MRPTASIIFANNNFLVRENYAENPVYFVIPASFAHFTFDGTRTVLQDTRTRTEYELSFYGGYSAAPAIYSQLLFDVFVIESVPPFPAPEAATVAATINGTADATLEALIDIEGNQSNRVRLYQDSESAIAETFNNYLSELGLAGDFMVTKSAIVEGQAFTLAVTCTDCWAENMALVVINGENTTEETFIID